MAIDKLIILLKKGLPEELNGSYSTGQKLTINELQKMRNKYPEFPWQQLLLQIDLRRKADKKFLKSSKMLFTQKGFEQASSEKLADFHAQKTAPATTIADLCCGIGADLMKTAVGKKKIFAFDIDEETLNCAKYNCRNLDNIIFSNSSALNFNKQVDLIFADPDRRPSSKRTIDPEEMSPPFSKLLSFLYEKKLCKTLMLKLAPALDFETLEREVLNRLADKGYYYCWDFVSESGVLKEILLTVSKDIPAYKREATILPDGYSLKGTGKEIIAVGGWQRFLFEPDNAVIRGGLVNKLGIITGFKLLDKHIPLLSGNEIVMQKYGSLFEVVKLLPWRKKIIQRYIRDNMIGELIIKTRGLNKTSEDLLKEFKLKGHKKLILLVVRIGKSYQAAVLERC